MRALVIIFLVGLSCSVLAQSSLQFQNLDFEDSTLNPYQDGPYYTATTASALPSWTVSVDGSPVSIVGYNGISTGATTVTVVSLGDQYVQPIEGTYSAVLQGIASTISLSQTGVVPANTKTFLFDATTVDENFLGAKPLQLFVGGQSVPFYPVAVESSYTLYAADFSAWAGQSEQLTFTVGSGNYSNWELDDLRFSQTQMVPEPHSFFLCSLSALVFLIIRVNSARPTR